MCINSAQRLPATAGGGGGGDGDIEGENKGEAGAISSLE